MRVLRAGLGSCTHPLHPSERLAPGWAHGASTPPRSGFPPCVTNYDRPDFRVISGSYGVPSLCFCLRQACYLLVDFAAAVPAGAPTLHWDCFCYSRLEIRVWTQKGGRGGIGENIFRLLLTFSEVLTERPHPLFPISHSDSLRSHP